MDSNNDEIICISSDDDEDTRQVLFKNKIITKKESVVNLSENNCNSSSNSLSSSTRMSFNDNRKVKECVLKRKLSEINDDDNDDGSSVGRSSKFACKQGGSVKAHNLKEETEKMKKEDKTLLKPKLIIKEKRTICSVEQDIFPMFISLCLQKDRSDDMKKIVNKLKRRYEQLDPSYANSEVFIDFLNEKRNEIMESNCKLYTYINDVMNEMKNSSKGKWILSSNSKSYFSGGNKLNRVNNSNISTAMCSNMSHTSNSIINDNDNEIALTNINDEEEQEKEFAVHKKIGKILKAMKKCEKIIKKLEELEIDFDDENNSSYIKLERYKYRMVELYNKYCEYTGENTDAGRQYLRPKHFSTTGIVSVDHAISSFINSKILRRNKLKKIGDFTKALIFPDYSDILKCVTKCNELHSLGLNDRKRQDIAKKAFNDLGDYLQKCRRDDYWDTFSLFLEGKEDDPALKNTELAEKLIQNKKTGETKLLSIFEEYTKKQEQMKDIKRSFIENEDDNEDSVENNDDDDDDDEEDDNDNNEEVENDDVSDIDINLDTDNNKSSSENDSTDETEIVKNKTNIRTKSDTGETNSGLEMGEICQKNINDRLRGYEYDKFKSEKVSNVNTSDCTNNFKSAAMMENDTISTPDLVKDLNTTSNISLSIRANNKIIIDKTKEDDPNTVNESLMDEKSLEDKEEDAEEKPLLRVRSFAKPPITWKDGQEKIDERNKNETTVKTPTTKDTVDLTQNIAQENSVHQRATIQVIPIVKGNCKTFVIPTGKSIINVKNITNTYVYPKNTESNNATKLGSSQIISPLRVIDKNTKFIAINKISSNLPANQGANTNNQIQNSETKQKSTNSVLQSNQIVVLPMKQKENTSQSPKTNSSSSESK